MNWLQRLRSMLKKASLISSDNDLDYIRIFDNFIDELSGISCVTALLSMANNHQIA